jgi:site-specific DNA recombinase
VAVYIRWSTDDQGEGTTLDVQLEGCRHYALSQGWQVRPGLIFIDDGYSGGTLDRPAMNRLRAAVQQGAVDCVIVFKMDRLSRNVVDTVNLVLREWEGKCHVKSAREAIDTASQQGKMFFYTLVSFAEWERSVIRERTWSGRMRRLMEGRNPGFRPPYGLTTGPTPGSFAVVEAEAATVQRIYELYARGLGYKAIAVQLGQEGIRFREGRPWSAQTVMAILRNPIYTGRLEYGRAPRTRGRRAAEAAPTVVESPHLPRIITPDQFARAQQTRLERAHEATPNRAVSSDHLLTGLLRCLQCGSAMMGRRKYGAGDAPPYYICSGQRAKGTGFCDNGYVRQDWLDEWLVTRLLERCGAAPSPSAADPVAGSAGQVAEVRRALEGLRREAGALERELGVIGRDYRQERLTLEEYREQKAAVDRERARLGAREAELAESLARLEAVRTLPVAVDRVAGWPALPRAQQKHVLRELVDHLAVYRAPAGSEVRYEITWVTGDAQANSSHRGQEGSSETVNFLDNNQ